MLRFLLPALAALTATASAQPAASALRFESADGRVVTAVGGKLHADARAFVEGPVGEAPGFLVRRARAKLGVEVDGRIRAVGEVGLGEGDAELVDGYVEADVGRGVAVRAGRFKTPFGFESRLSSSDLRLAERSLATELSPRRDVGAMVWGAWRRLEAQAGVFNGVPDGSSRQVASDAALDAVGRVFAVPVDRPGLRLGVGIAVAAGREHGDSEQTALSDVETTGDRTAFAYRDGVFADGPRVRVAPQATLDAGRLHVLGERTWARHRLAAPGSSSETEAPRLDVDHRAWNVTASVVLAGAPRGARRPVPRHDVTEGGLGALEVSARVHQIRLDPDADPLAADESAQRATAAGVAVQWSPVAHLRLGMTAERTVLEAFRGGRLPSETLVIARAAFEL